LDEKKDTHQFKEEVSKHTIKGAAFIPRDIFFLNIITHERRRRRRRSSSVFFFGLGLFS